MFDLMGLLGSGAMSPLPPMPDLGAMPGAAPPVPTPPPMPSMPMPDRTGSFAAPPGMPMSGGLDNGNMSLGGGGDINAPPMMPPGGPTNAQGGTLGGGIDAMQQSNAWAQIGNSAPGSSLGGTGSRGTGNVGLPSSPSNPDGVLGKGTKNPFASIGKGMMQQASAPQQSAPKTPGSSGGGTGGIAPFQPMEFQSPTQLGGQGQGRNMVPRSPFAPF